MWLDRYFFGQVMFPHHSDCLKGHKSLGSLGSVVKGLIVSLVGRTYQGTRSPIELFWTAKKST